MSIMSMRERSQGLTTKIIIGLIIIAFAFFGLGSITTFLTPVAKVATVNGEDVTVAEMEMAVERNRRIMLGQGATPESIDEDALRSDVLQSLVSRKLLTQAVEDLGITASDASIDASLLKTEAFQVAGVFDPNQYRLVLANAGYNPLSYREELRIDQAVGQLAEAVRASAFLTDSETNRVLALSRQTRDVAYMTFRKDTVAPDVIVEPGEAEAYYEENPNLFFSEEMVDIEFVTLSRSQMMADVTVTEEALRDFYAMRLDLYSSKERRQIAHILIAISDDRDKASALAEIEAIQQALAEGQAFEILAEERSDDPGSAMNGGDLGYAEPDIFVAPFEAAAFALSSVGEVSPPVETEFGFHLIRLTALEPSQVEDFEVVRGDVDTAFRQEAVRERYIEKMSELDELAFEDEDLTGIETQLGLTIEQRAGVSRQDDTGIMSESAVKAAVFSPDLLIDGNNSAVIETSDGEAIVVRVSAYQESRLKPFELVEADIVDRLKTERASTLVQSQAEQAVAMLESGDITRVVADQFDLEWSVAGAMTRYETELPKALVEKAFALPKPAKAAKSVGLAVLDSGDVAVVSVTNVNNPATAEFAGENQAVSQLLANQRGGLEFQALQTSLQQLSDVDGAGL